MGRPKREPPRDGPVVNEYTEHPPQGTVDSALPNPAPITGKTHA